jgi:multisubunit Na+/H+ antiporter MnhG subunit
MVLRDIWSEEFSLQHVMIFHSTLCVLFGVIAVFLPHNFYDQLHYDHMAHEYLRMYGALTVSIGWFVWRTQDITDGRLKKVICETFGVTYLLQGVVMLKAHTSIPRGHSPIHLLLAFIFLTIGSLYGYMRFIKQIKIFELPGGREG